MKPYILAEKTWKSMKEEQPEVAVLPWGATEAHNYHLPFCTDNLQVERIAAESAAKAWEQGAKVIVLPVVPFGVHTGQFDIKLNLNINPSTQLTILKDLVDSLERHKIMKLLIINGHGGNDFRQIIRELDGLHQQMFICTCNWFRALNTSEFFENGGGHADEMETSLMQHLAPGLILPLSEAGEGKERKFRVAALNEDWAWAERKWSKVTDDTGIGNPFKSTPEKGKRFFDAVTDKIAILIRQLSVTPVGDMYRE